MSQSPMSDSTTTASSSPPLSATSSSCHATGSPAELGSESADAQLPSSGGSGLPSSGLSSSSVMIVTTRIASSRMKPSLQAPGAVSGPTPASSASMVCSSPGPMKPREAMQVNAATRSGWAAVA